MSPAFSTTRGRFLFSEFQVDLAQRTLLRAGSPVPIGSKTFDLLVYLLQHARRVVTKEELMDALWPDATLDQNNLSSLSQHVVLLRKALTAAQQGDRIVVSVPGRGYHFAAAVIEAPDEEPEPGHMVETTPRPEPPSGPVAEITPSARADARTGERIADIDAQTTFSATQVETPPYRTSAQQEDEDQRVCPAKSRRIEDRSADLSDERPASSPLQAGPAQVALLTALLVLAAAGGWMGWRYLHRPHGSYVRVILADVENSTGDADGNADLGPALKTALAIDLQQSPYLDLATEEQLRDNLREMNQPTAQPLTPALARAVCRHGQTQVGQAPSVYLTVSVSRFLQKYLVAVQAFQCSGNASLARTKGIADSPDGVLTVLDKVAIDLRRQLGEPTKSVERFHQPLFAGRKASLVVLQAYSEATSLGVAGKKAESVPLFQRIIQLDPKFAMAYADLGVTYSQLGEYDLARANLTRAYELRDTADEQQRLFIADWYNLKVTGDVPARLRELKSWSELYPRNRAPLLEMAELQTQIGRAAQALEPARRALVLDPLHGPSYVTLARAQMSVGQFEAATATCRQAILAHIDHIDEPELHEFLYQVAFLRLDQPAMDEQVTWAKSQPEDSEAELGMLLQQGRMEFAAGRVRAGQAALATLVDDYHNRGMTDQANALAASIPRMEAELGLAESALALLQRLPDSDAGNEALIDSSTDVPMAWAAVGETSRAEAILARELAAHPNDTLWQEEKGPLIRAAIALNQQQAQAAIDALQVAVPYDLSNFALPALRGRAGLGALQPVLAETEFHKILDHPGIDPLSYNYPLAQLGLARALVQQGKIVEAGFAYKVLFQIWKDADPDLPRLRAAQAEYARLSAPAATKPQPATKPKPAAKPRPAVLSHALPKPGKN